MTWSTAQVAELTGTTVRTVRHYHDVGLLAEPVRRANGYKCYGVRHVVRVLRIKRLTELGLSLSQIGRLDARPTVQTLRELDAELAEAIERLERSRGDLAAILAHASAPGRATELGPELPEEVPDAVIAGLSPVGRELLVLGSRVLAPAGLAALGAVLAGYRSDPVGREFEALTDGADDDARHDLAQRLAPHAHRAAEAILAGAPGGAGQAGAVLRAAVEELCNDAQRDVLRLARQLPAARPRTGLPVLTPAGAG